jgi:hypothetical protein
MDLKSFLFSVALFLFLLIASAKLIVEELIALVILCKKLKTAYQSELPSQPHPSLDQTRSKRELGSGGP